MVKKISNMIKWLIVMVILSGPYFVGCWVWHDFFVEYIRIGWVAWWLALNVSSLMYLVVNKFWAYVAANAIRLKKIIDL